MKVEVAVKPSLVRVETLLQHHYNLLNNYGLVDLPLKEVINNLEEIKLSMLEYG